MNLYCHLKKLNDRLTLIRFDRAAPLCYYPGEPGIVGYLCPVRQPFVCRSSSSLIENKRDVSPI